jgi:hypothetical protein
MKWLFAAAVAALFALGVLAAGLGIAHRESGDAARETAALDRPDEGPYSGSEPPGRIELVDFALRDHEGALVRSSDLHEKVVLLTFLDSQCKEACPVIAAQVAHAFRLAEPRRAAACLRGRDLDRSEGGHRSERSRVSASESRARKASLRGRRRAGVEAAEDLEALADPLLARVR